MRPPWRWSGKKAAAPDKIVDGKPADRGPGSRPPIQRAGLGLLYLAIGRREGFADFGNTVEAYLSSLAPLLAFNLVTHVLLAASGYAHAAALTFLATLCFMLIPAVVSHPLCRRWGADANWPRFVNILNWSWMLLFLLVAVAGAAARLFVAGGLPLGGVQSALLLGTMGYLLWFQWFVVRGALGISRWRAFWLLLACGAANLVILELLLMVGAKPAQFPT